MLLKDIPQNKAVKVGDFFLPPEAIRPSLRRYCKQILATNDSELYPYSLRGSGCAVRMMGASFIFCCWHQIHDYLEDQIVFVPRVADRLTITCSAAYKATVADEDSDVEVNDLRAFQFVEDNYSIPNLRSEFLTLDKDSLFPGDVSEFGIYYAIGFPSSRQKINDDDIPRIQAHQILVKGRYVGRSNSPHVHRLQMDNDGFFDPDGMSGGPVFYLGGRPGSYFIGLAGMIVRGSSKSDILHFVDSDYLWQVAASATNAESRLSAP